MAQPAAVVSEAYYFRTQKSPQARHLIDLILFTNPIATHIRSLRLVEPELNPSG
jgi:hypothetical protein